MFGEFWGDHVKGKMIDIIDLIHEDNSDNAIKVLPTLENGQYGSAQLLLESKPSNECLNKLKEFYQVRIFKDENNTDYKYLMNIETLRYAYEEGWHWGNKDGINKDITHNRYDYDGYFYVTDTFNEYRRIAIIPFSVHAYELDGGYNLAKEEALIMVKTIVKQLNNGEIFK